MLLFALAGAADGADGPPHGPWYRIDRVEIRYAEDRPALPSVERLAASTRLRLKRVRGTDAPPHGEKSGRTWQVGGTRMGGGYAPVADASEGQLRKLSELDELEPPYLHATAIRAASRALVAELNGRGFGGVSVSVDPEALRPTGPEGAAADKDDDGEGEPSDAAESASVLRLTIRLRTVSEVRTRASGERFGGEKSENLLAHAAVRANSPVGPDERDGVLHTDDLEAYVEWLNRHPGRRVDVAVSGAEAPRSLALEYMIHEPKPWVAYAQVANTGTDQTEKIRERLGFRHYQLTGHDDILSVDYVTAGFEKTHTAIASYEAPLLDVPRVRWTVDGSYNQFVASDVGRAGEEFTGESHAVGGELSWNFFQRGKLFVDAVGGADYRRVSVRNELFDPPLEGTDGFFLPRAGLRLERSSRIGSTRAAGFFEWNVAGVGGTDSESASRLGRMAVDEEWTLFRWDLSQSVYLEPLINREAWEDLATPGSSTLVHEVSLGFRGQRVLGDDRVIPQLQRTAGGLHTVRGYPESTAVGDNAAILSAEYRYHVPKALAPSREPAELFGRPFHWRPRAPQGSADWDLVLKAFIDYARTTNNAARPGEQDEELLGAGVGAEVRLLRNLNARVAWGHALKATSDVSSGTSEIHFSVTVLY